PAGWSCGFNPATVPAGSGPPQGTLTLHTGSATALNFPRVPFYSPRIPRNILLAAPSPLLLGPFLLGRLHKTPHVLPGLALGFAALLLLAAGCGSGSSEAPRETSQAVTVSFTVNATSGSTAASVPFTVTVRLIPGREKRTCNCVLHRFW